MDYTEKEKHIIKKALLIRKTEEALLSLFKQGDINGTVHTCVGQEFIGAVLSNIMIDDDTDRASIIIGPLIDELLLNSNELFDDSDDIINEISKHITLSIDSNSDSFSILKMSNENLPHIDVFYSE